jgi:hypothetical protein
VSLDSNVPKFKLYKLLISNDFSYTESLSDLICNFFYF